MTKTVNVKNIALTAITVSNLEKAKHLFVDLLGLKLKEYNEKFHWMELGIPSDPSARLGFGQYCKERDGREMQPGMNGIPSIEVEDIEKVKSHLEAHGIDFPRGIMEVPGEVKLALFKDSNGNRYFLSEQLKEVEG